MDIKTKIYSELSPTQRAIACFSAINRVDGTEIDRLIAHASRDSNFKKALFALGQAVDAYNRLSAETISAFLILSCRLQAASSYCSAWLEAGGAVEASGYRENTSIIESLTPRYEQSAGEVYSIRQAAREWCAAKRVPHDIFARPICPFPLPKEEGAQCDTETLNAFRSLFDKITLSW